MSLLWNTFFPMFPGIILTLKSVLHKFYFVSIILICVYDLESVYYKAHIYVWALGIEFRFLGLVASDFTQQAISLTVFYRL